MEILTLNQGSSSLKYAVCEMPGSRIVTRGSVEGRGRGALDAVLDRLEGVPLAEAIGHRVVHGGDRYGRAARVDAAVERAIEAHAPLAPVHNPAALEVLRAVRERRPDVPQVAVFDTAFHRDLPPAARHYALPWELAQKHGLRRYGFHGISVRAAVEGAAAHAGVPVESLDAIVAHLGAGCSVTAVRGGRSLDTTMGFTPLEGLVMGTRSGDVDPGALLFLLRHADLDADRLGALLNGESGLLGLSGVSSHVHELESAAERGHERAALALEVFVLRARKAIGAALAVVPRPRALVLTGGIGERAIRTRARILEDLAPLGLVLDDARNAAVTPGPGPISADASPIEILVLPCDEERAIARETFEALGPDD